MLWLLACAAPTAWAPWSGLGPACAVDVAGPGGLAAAWVPCGDDCERLDLPEDVQLDQAPDFARVDGGVRLGLTLPAADHQDLLLVDESGSVRAAVRRRGARDTGCWLLSSDVRGDEWVLRVRLDDGDGSLRTSREERIVRVVDGVAHLDPWTDHTERTWSIHLGGDGADWWVEAPGRSIWRGAEQVWAPAQAGDGPVGPVARGPDGLVVTMREGGRRQIWSLTAAGATRWAGDGERGDVGSDGVDVVWTALDGEDWSIWTAPWGHPEAGRRLGPDPTRLRPAPWVVGDGVAAHLGAAPGSLDAVDLSDGRTTTIPAPAGLEALSPLGIAGGMVYARGWGAAAGVYRFRVGGHGALAIPSPSD